MLNKKPGLDREDEENDKSNPFVNIIKAIFSFIWTVITLPFKFIWYLLKLLNDVRMAVLGLLTLIFIIILSLVLIFIFKPAFIWEPLKGFLNSDIQTPIYQNLTEQNIYQKINSGGMNEIMIGESEVTYLFRKANLINENSLIGLTDNTITVYFDADTKESPLWVFIKSRADETGNLKIDSTGFGRFSMPNFVSNWLASGFNAMMDLLGKQNRNSSLVIVMNQILDSKQVAPVIRLKSAEIRQGEIVLKYDIIGLD